MGLLFILVLVIVPVILQLPYHYRDVLHLLHLPQLRCVVFTSFSRFRLK